MTTMQHARLLVLLVLPLLAACDKKEEAARPEVSGYFVFGTAYGECLGNCAHLFKIEDGQLFADEDIEYINPAGGELHFREVPLPEAKYLAALPLVAAFPDRLWDETAAVIGMPDAYDQGSIIIERIVNGEPRRWVLDTDPRNLPAYLHDFVEAVARVTWELQQ